MVGTDGRRAYVYHTAVHPDYRRYGIARRLVDQVLIILKDLGIHKASLVVFEKNAEGNHFWEALGFSARADLVYRDKALTKMERIDT